MGQARDLILRQRGWERVQQRISVREREIGQGTDRMASHIVNSLGLRQHQPVEFRLGFRR